MLKDKTAVITGSTSGIGLGIAKAMARQGANVVINGLGSAKDNSAAVAEVAELTAGDVVFNGANMMRAEEIAGLIQSSSEQFGSVDILVNNAGIQHVAPIEEFPEGKWDAIMAINLSAAFHATKAVVAGMKQKGWGRIINTASAHALIASPYKSAYVAAKHGIAGLTKVLALELGEFEITANAICPGYVWTPLVEDQIADTAKSRGMTPEEVKKNVLLEAQPTKEFVTVEQVADFAVFLCSDAAQNINGAILPIDGGWTAH